MNTRLVADWFGDSFGTLHPLLQQLHRHGGQLSGTVEVTIPSGLTGVLGRRLAYKLGIPTQGRMHALVVTISHSGDGLHWDRCFDAQTSMQSIFQPIGIRQNGYWIESTGPVKLFLTVDTTNGGWQWRCLKMKLGWLRLPMFLFPNSTAYKTIESGRYRFHVGFALPFLGTILSYGGLLTANIDEACR